MINRRFNPNHLLVTENLGIGYLIQSVDKFYAHMNISFLTLSSVLKVLFQHIVPRSPCGTNIINILHFAHVILNTNLTSLESR